MEEKEVENNKSKTQKHSTKHNKPLYTKWWFYVLIVCSAFFWGIYLSGYRGSDTTNTTNTSKNKNETIEVQTPPETREEYIEKCEEYTYEEIARNPKNYIGKRAKFTGEVIQTQESYGNNLVLRVNVTLGEYDIWKDTIWVNYKYADDSESRVLEDDIIDIYGEMKEQKSYTSILGASITIPQIDAKYIDIQ